MLETKWLFVGFLSLSLFLFLCSFVLVLAGGGGGPRHPRYPRPMQIQFQHLSRAQILLGGPLFVRTRRSPKAGFKAFKNSDRSVSAVSTSKTAILVSQNGNFGVPKQVLVDSLFVGRDSFEGTVSLATLVICS